jgi:hypothetical protein
VTIAGLGTIGAIGSGNVIALLLARFGWMAFAIIVIKSL